MRQVDWEQVALDAASNRGEGWYRKVVRGVLQERIEAIGAGEGGEEGEEGEEGGKEIGEEMGEN